MADTQRCFELLGKGDADGLRRLLEEDPGTAEARDASGVSLLMHALYRGRRDLAELIAARRANSTSSKPRRSASWNGSRTALAMAQPSTRARTMASRALHFACFFGQPDAARLLIENGSVGRRRSE